MRLHIAFAEPSRLIRHHRKRDQPNKQSKQGHKPLIRFGQ
jgi:hypothetical protein